MDKNEAVNKLEYAFSIGADVSAACSYANISRQTYYNWTDEDAELKERFDTLREKPALLAYDTIFKNLNKEETAKWYLERKKKAEFSTKQEVENTGEVSMTIIWQDTNEQSQSLTSPEVG